MQNSLLETTVKELLKKFGAGGHKPGSGSAAALDGLIAAQLMVTVIDLTSDPKRKALYASNLSALLTIKHQITSVIYPALEDLFQKDSDCFAQVINLRNQRDAEKNFKKKQELTHQASEQLLLSSEIPLEIADYCLQLAEHAISVFEYGFKSARGDSAVTLLSAIAAAGSCLCITELNLCSLPVNERSEKIRAKRISIRRKYEGLRPEEIKKLDLLQIESEENKKYQEETAYFKNGNLAHAAITDEEIEEIAIRLQDFHYEYRKRIWKKQQAPEYDIDLIKPDVVIQKIMGYQFEKLPSLGKQNVNERLFEIAGIIDKKQKLVRISRNFSEETQKFTAAHELGHLLLHKTDILHRDRPIDGSSIQARDTVERQADKFAAYFLMPELLVRQFFQSAFETELFVINDEMSFNLLGRSGDIQALRRRCKNLRGLAQLVASLKTFKASQITPMHEFFEVSINAMAIRLEELSLVRF